MNTPLKSQRPCRHLEIIVPVAWFICASFKAHPMRIRTKQEMSRVNHSFTIEILFYLRSSYGCVYPKCTSDAKLDVIKKITCTQTQSERNMAMQIRAPRRTIILKLITRLRRDSLRRPSVSGLQGVNSFSVRLLTYSCYSSSLDARLAKIEPFLRI